MTEFRLDRAPGTGPRLDEGGLISKPAEIPDPLLSSCYQLFSGPEIEKSQILGPDPFLPRPARCARMLCEGAIRQPARRVWGGQPFEGGPVGQSRGRRTGRALQPKSEVLLRFCCRCSDGRSTTQLSVAVA